MWDINEIGGDKVREMVSGLESKFPRLLVALGRVNGLDGRFWTARLRTRDVESGAKDAENQFKGYYLAGVSCRDDDMDAQGKRLFTGKVITAMREFERSVKEAREMEGGNIWVSMEVVPKKKIVDMDLIVDEMDWGRVEELHSTNSTTLVPHESYLKAEVPTGGSNPQTKSHQRAHSDSLRPAQDIISRIHWDPVLSVDDFVIGYEDRFVGVKEIELGKWKSEQTDEEFIPRHRIVWVRRKGEDGEKVWHRRKKVDLIFGSGNGRGKGERA